MSVLPEVSVIMPVYNGASFVEAALESVLGQGGSLQVLLHDDGSTDGTIDLLKRMAQDDTRLIVSSGSNCGAAAARNHCIDRAEGEFIAFQDHDDLWPQGRLSRHVAMLSADPSIDAVLGHTEIFEHLDPHGRPARSPRSRRVLCGLLQAALFRRRAITQLAPFDVSLAAADDFDLILRFIESGLKLQIDPEVAVYYRLHEGQWTADRRFASSQTVRALHRSLQRRRRDGKTFLDWQHEKGSLA